MLRITDRYIVREVVPPFLLALLVLTFVLMLPPLMRQAEDLIARGVDGTTIARMMLMLVPQGLGLAIPTALLIGILMGLGRMSTDRETVALQACGVSVYRMLWPVALFAVLATGATFHVIEVVVPDANQRFRELSFRVLASRAEGEVKPRVFYDGFEGLTLYVREVSPAGWSDVFLADSRDPARLDVSVAEHGRVEIDRGRQTVDLVLHNGTRHRSDARDPAAYELHEFGDIRFSIGAEAVFPQGAPERGLNEMRLPELRAEAERLRAGGEPRHAPIMEMHERFSVPVACLVFALIGVGLGITTRKDAKSSSFALGIGVIFVYYVSMYLPEAMAKGALVSPHLAKWLPNIVLGLAGLGLVFWRSHLSERRIAWRRFGGRRSRGPGAGPAREARKDARKSAPPVMRLSPRGLRGLSLLDWYVVLMYLRWVRMGVVGLLAIFYISTFIDLSDKLFKGQTSLPRLLEYFWFATPQFVYYVLPISALVATLVTIGALTRSSELTVMKACGVSLARVALPMFALSLVWSACLFALEEGLLGAANRRAEAIRHEIRSGVPPPSNLLDRRWIAGEGNTIYHTRYIDHERLAIDGLSAYELEDEPWRLGRRTFAAHAEFVDGWEGREVWTRRFPAAADGGAAELTSAAAQALSFVDPPATFRTEQPDPEVMGFRELDRYIETLRARGLDVVSLVVAMHRKASFPFVCLVLTLIAVPFAVTTGSRGTLYGVGAGIVLAFSYWVILSIFGAIGSAGLLAPALAAWAPNVLFGGTAAYFLLAART